MSTSNILKVNRNSSVLTQKLAVLFVCCLSFFSFSQKIEKESLSKLKFTYWDASKTQIQSKGKYYVDIYGESTDKHGKWYYFDKLGGMEEVRHYNKGMLSGSVIKYFPNGTKLQEGFFKNNRQDSIYTEWFESGKVKMEGFYRKGNPEKKWKYYYRDGSLKIVEEIKAGTNYTWEFYLQDSLHTQTVIDGNGELTTYYTIGSVKEWYNYKDGLKNGDFEEISIYGYLTLKGSFKNGKKDGEWQYFYYSGEKEKVSHYEDGVLHGAYNYFYDNGQLNVEGSYKNGKKFGEWKWYTNSGKKDMVGNFNENLQHGEWKYWLPTGELSYEAFYKDGLRSGEWIYYYKDGVVFKKGNFDNDLKHGEWKTWYEDETLLMEGEYKKGKEQGEWNNYWENAQLKNTATFNEGKLDGEWLSFNPKGKSKLIGEYSDNMKMGAWRSFFDNGKPKDVMTYKLFKKKSKMNHDFFKNRDVMESKLHGKSISYSGKDYKRTEEGNYKEGVKHGEWTAFYPGGKTSAVVSHYKNGELAGNMTQYTRRAKIMSEIQYKDGLKHGTFKLFDKKGKVVSEKNFSQGMQIIEGSNNKAGSFSPGR